MGCSSTKKQGCLLGWTASWTERWIFSSSRSSSSSMLVVVCMVVKWTICSIRLLSWPHTERVEKWCFRFQYSRVSSRKIKINSNYRTRLKKKYVEDPKRDPKGKIPLLPEMSCVTKTRTIYQREPPNQFQQCKSHQFMRGCTKYIYFAHSMYYYLCIIFDGKYTRSILTKVHNIHRLRCCTLTLRLKS